MCNVFQAFTQLSSLTMAASPWLSPPLLQQLDGPPSGRNMDFQNYTSMSWVPNITMSSSSGIYINSIKTFIHSIYHYAALDSFVFHTVWSCNPQYFMLIYSYRIIQGNCQTNFFFKYFSNIKFYLHFSTFNWVLGTSNPMDYIVPAFCLNSKLEETQTAQNFFTVMESLAMKMRRVE